MTIVDTPTGADFCCGGGGASEGVLDAGLALAAWRIRRQPRTGDPVADVSRAID